MSDHNIVFKVKGSNKIGFGHVSRCLALIEQLPDNWRGVLLVNDSPSIKAFLSKRDVTTCHSISELENSAPSFDAAVIDQPEDDPAFLEETKKRYGCPTLGLDFWHYDNPHIDIIVNLYGNADGPPPQDGHFVYRESLKYAIINKRFHPFRDNSRTANEQVERVIIMFGGADPLCNTAKAIKFLESEKQALKVDVIIGPLFAEKETIQQEAEHSPHTIICHENPDNLPELMAAADLAISGCATTFFEFSFLGTPTVILSQNEQETRFCRYLEKEELTLFDEGNLRSTWTLAQKKEVRDKHMRRQMSVFDGQGPRRILAELPNFP